jgi:hypothetical protein
VLLFTVCSALLVACDRSSDTVTATAAPAAPAKYLYVFAGFGDHTHGSTGQGADTAAPSDFLAVIDVDSSSPTYAKIVGHMATGASASMPHHTEMLMPDSGLPFVANAYMANTSYLIDVSSPTAPTIAGRVDSVPGYELAHSFARLPNGDVIGTLQYSTTGAAGRPGAIARFSREGKLLKVGSAADPAFPGGNMRTYSLDISTATDRVVTTSVAMDPAETNSADVIQLWRLSDLSLLHTLPLPPTTTDSTSRYPFELRFLSDGRSALLNTLYCGFYLASGLDTDTPTITPVLALEHPRHVGCAVPLLIGHWWIMPISSTFEFVVYDVSNPRTPRRVGALQADSSFVPHWISRDPHSDRLVFTAEGPVPAVRLAHFDTTSGALRWDERFRERAGGPLGVSFNRQDWPAGAKGSAAPHGAIFSRQ